MAPEAQAGNHAVFKSDMYSAGLILYFMMVKELPIDGELNIPKEYSAEIKDLCASLLA